MRQGRSDLDYDRSVIGLRLPRCPGVLSAAVAAAILAATSPLLAADGRVADSASDVRPIGVGARIPDAEVRTILGEPVRLDALTGGGVVALVFYRGGW